MITEIDTTKPPANPAPLAVYEQQVRVALEIDTTMEFNDEIERQNWINWKVTELVNSKRKQLEYEEQKALKAKQKAEAATAYINEIGEKLKVEWAKVPEEPDNYAEVLADYTKQNTQVLQRYFRRLDLDLTDADILKIWESRHRRRFRLRTCNENIWRPRAEQEIFCFFTPLSNPRQHLISAGFFTKYIDKPTLKLREGLLQQKKKLFQNFIVNGREARSLYICGDLGVGKSTFLGNIAMALVTFLDIQIHHITMPKLLRLITSIDSDDKAKVALLERCSVLFVDDIGHEEYTTVNQASAMRDFFTCRYGNDLSTFLAGNGNIMERTEDNNFYRQIADYINESGVWTLCKVSGESYRGAADSNMCAAL